jgi:hypothetical protein
LYECYCNELGSSIAYQLFSCFPLLRWPLRLRRDWNEGVPVRTPEREANPLAGLSNPFDLVVHYGI